MRHCGLARLRARTPFPAPGPGMGMDLSKVENRRKLHVDSAMLKWLNMDVKRHIAIDRARAHGLADQLP